MYNESAIKLPTLKNIIFFKKKKNVQRSKRAQQKVPQFLYSKEKRNIIFVVFLPSYTQHVWDSGAVRKRKT